MRKHKYPTYRNEWSDQGWQSHDRGPRLPEDRFRNERHYEKRNRFSSRERHCFKYNNAEGYSDDNRHFGSDRSEIDDCGEKFKIESNTLNDKGKANKDDEKNVPDNNPENNIDPDKCEVKRTEYTKISYADYKERKQIEVKANIMNLEEARYENFILLLTKTSILIFSLKIEYNN